MKMPDHDHDLLYRYASEGDEAAFENLVKRHLALVHGVAKRITGHKEMAEDVCQRIFIRLANQAGQISRSVVIQAWLHRATRSLAIDLVRAEASRSRLEANYPCRSVDSDPESIWALLAPVIDDAVDLLPQAYREVILLRFFRNLTHVEAGRILGLSEQAARKRTTRALERLRALLSRRGVVTTSSALSLILPTQAAPTISSSLAASIFRAVLFPSLSNVRVFTSRFIYMTVAQKLIMISGSALIFIGLAAAGFGSLGLNAFDVASPPPTPGTSPGYLGRPLAVADRSNSPKSQKEYIAAIRAWLVADHTQNTGMRRLEFIHNVQFTLNSLTVDSIREIISSVKLIKNEAEPREELFPWRAFIINGLCKRFGELSPNEALAWAFPSGQPLVDFPTGYVLEGAAKVDPEQAFAVFASLPTGDNAFRGDITFADIVKGWAALAPEQLIAALPGFEPRYQIAAFSAFVRQLGPATEWELETQRFRELLGSRSSENINQQTGAPLAARWAMTEPAAAFQWLSSLPKAPDQSGVQAVFQEWILTEPDFAADVLRNHKIPEVDNDDFYAATLQFWAGDRPSLLVAILECFHDPVRRDQVVAESISKFQESALVVLQKSSLLSTAMRATVAQELNKR